MADLKNEFTWSNARDEAFRRCARQYFFNYYGAWGGWDQRADPRRRTLYVLKQLKTRPTWAGDRVRDSLRTALATLQRGEKPPDEKTAVEQTLLLMREDYRQSGEGLYWDDPKKIPALFEHEYDIELSDAQWKETVDGALDGIRNFYRSDLFKTLCAVPRDQWLNIETRASLPIDDVNVFVQLDAAQRDGDGVVIYDWTCPPGQDTSRGQLACHALYAVTYWRAPVEKIRFIEFNVTRNEVREHRLTQADLDATRQEIISSARAMRELLDDPASNSAREARFDFAPDEKTCLRCNFVRVCPRFTPDAP